MIIKISIYFDPEQDFHNFLVWVFKWLFKIAKIHDDWAEKRWKKKKAEYENAKSLMKAFEDWNVSCGRAPNDFGEENDRAMEKFRKSKITAKFILNLYFSFFAFVCAVLLLGVHSVIPWILSLYTTLSLLAFIFVFLKNS